MYYKSEITRKARLDLDRISEYLVEYSYNKNKIIEKIHKDINKLEYMPRIHKTLIHIKDKDGEYRRIVSGKYIIVYKIIKDRILILRVFNQRENYLNHKKFILKEKSKKYIITK